MNKSLLLFITTFIFVPTAVYASDLSWGDPDENLGEIKLSGAIRTHFSSKDYQEKANEGQNNLWRLADIRLVLDYENPDWLASIDGRCYRYDQLCDAVFLRHAWLGYKFDDEQRLNLGLQPIDFGLGEFWGSSYYETLMNTVGFEDISNLGIQYQLSHQNYHLSLGFYPRDGGNYKGTSKDSSRYSANFVEADDLDEGTHLKEKNMWIGRLSKKFSLNDSKKMSTELGTSFWYSDIENKRTQQNGHRNTWNIFATTNYGDWQWMSLYGEQKIKNRDDFFPEYSTLGAFDFPYQLANKGQYLVNEINYTFQKPYFHLENIKPYLSHSRFFKDESGYKDSERLIGGVGFNYKAIGVQAEYIMSRNDPMNGGDAESLAQGNQSQNGWDKMFYLAVGYYF
ncbi:porin [Acinetobacter guerrae]|uniref:porin n=1 Tax=Acinetobacter guerrae TaxID=1843371 RepID=UPI00125ED77E|nr:porin [Acinetobacter guerrae]